MDIFYVALYLFYRDPGKGFCGLPSKVGNSPVSKSLTYLPGVISLGKQAWFCSSNFKNFNSLGPKAKKCTWLLGRSCHLRLTAICRDSVFLRIICKLSFLVYLESGKNSHKQNSGTKPFLQNHDWCKNVNKSQTGFFIISDEKLQTFEICRRTTTFFQRSEKMEEKYSLLSEHVGGQMIEFSQHTPTSTMSPSVDHHQML